MIETARAGIDWVLALGPRHGVDPVVFAAIYVGAIPFFFLFSGLAVRGLRAGRSAALWIVASGLCFISAYLYLAIAGHGISPWVWALLALLVGYGGWSAVQSVRRKLEER